MLCLQKISFAQTINFRHELIALGKLSSSQDILILHLKDRAYKNPAHIFAKEGSTQCEIWWLNADIMLCVAICKSELTRCEMCTVIYDGRQFEQFSSTPYCPFCRWLVAMFFWNVNYNLSAAMCRTPAYNMYSQEHDFITSFFLPPAYIITGSAVVVLSWKMLNVFPWHDIWGLSQSC